MSGEKYTQTLHGLHDMLLNPTPTQCQGTQGEARIDEVQCDRASPIFGVWAFNVNTSFYRALDVVGLTGLSAAPPEDIASVKELWTLSGAGHEVEENGFGFAHQQVRGDVERHIEGKAVCRLCESVVDASELIKKAHAVQAEGTRVDNRYQHRNKLHEEVGKFLRARRRSYQDEFDLQGESLATHQHLLQGFVERRRRPHQDHLHKD